jgi:Amt family ammonium transporter
MVGYDDALDTFGVHAIGGTLGAIMTGLLATGSVNGNLLVDGVAGKNGLKAAVEGHTLVFSQLKAVALTLVLAVVGTIVIAMIVKVIVGLRPTPEVETAGLDVQEHGEEGYVI